MPKKSRAVSSNTGLTNCLWRKAKGRVVGERPVATGAFQPQNPGAENTNKISHHHSKGTSAALVHLEGILGSTVGTTLGVTGMLSRLDFFRVVLDFLFGCHNLEGVLGFGGCVAIDHDPTRPPFSFPHVFVQSDRHRIEKKGGRGLILTNCRAGLKRRGAAGGRPQEAGVAGAGDGGGRDTGSLHSLR